MIKRYLYIHGLNSDRNSRSYQDLSKLLPNVYDLGYNYELTADNCYNQLCRQVEEHLMEVENKNQVVKLLGSSLGGYFTLLLAKKYALASLAFNPVTFPQEQLRPVIGINQNIYTQKKYDLTPEILESYQHFPLEQNLPIKPFLILGEKDELIQYNVALSFWQNTAYCILTDDVHSIANYSNYKYLMEIM